MINKIKSLVKENRETQKQILLQGKELEWAHVYHDSIRGCDWIEKLPLNVGRWAGNYAFFYVLNRILNDFKPKAIVEFGLGESTKFIMEFLENMLSTTEHLVVEQDENWKNLFVNNNNISQKTKIVVSPLNKMMVKGYETNSYSEIDKIVNKNYDLYIIDGPFGSEHFSRYDIVMLAENFANNAEFIIILDDYNRVGEIETTKDLLFVLNKNNIKVYTTIYKGTKDIFIIATEKYRYATTL
jgi:hypothetical protein